MNNKAKHSSRSAHLAVFQHHRAEGVGRIGEWARQNQARIEVFYAPEHLPESLDGYHGLILLGGPMNVNDNPSWMQAESSLIKQALDTGKPILGICLGAQLLATELGAGITGLDEAELGWHKVTFRDGVSLEVPQWHYQQISLPPHIEPVASSTLCGVQMFQHQIALDDQGLAFQAKALAIQAIGLQFHPEWDDEQLRGLKAAFGKDCPFELEENPLRQQALQDWLFPMLTQFFY